MPELEYKDFKEKFLKYLDEENYIAAYSNLRESGLNKMDRNELAGLYVKDILEKMDALPVRGASEKKAALRSFLLWVFRDYPGLANLYKGQLRGHLSDRKNFISFIGDMKDPDTAKERIGEEVNNFFDGVKQNLDDSADDIKNGRAQDKVKDFIDQAESNVKEGLKNIADIFDSVINKKNKDQ